MSRISLRRVSGSLFEAVGSGGNKAYIDGPESAGGKNAGIRPMEMVLMGLAGCSAVDILRILDKGRQEIVDLEVTVDGKRADTVPAVYTDIDILYEAGRETDLRKLERAASLSLEKYCSVARMLEPAVRITHRCRIRQS